MSSAAKDTVPSCSGVRSEDVGNFHRNVKAEIVSHCHVKAERDGTFHLDVKATAKIGAALKGKIGGP